MVKMVTRLYTKCIFEPPRYGLTWTTYGHRARDHRLRTPNDRVLLSPLWRCDPRNCATCPLLHVRRGYGVYYGVCHLLIVTRRIDGVVIGTKCILYIWLCDGHTFAQLCAHSRSLVYTASVTFVGRRDGVSTIWAIVQKQMTLSIGS